MITGPATRPNAPIETPRFIRPGAIAHHENYIELQHKDGGRAMLVVQDVGARLANGKPLLNNDALMTLFPIPEGLEKEIASEASLEDQKDQDTTLLKKILKTNPIDLRGAEDPGIHQTALIPVANQMHETVVRAINGLTPRPKVGISAASNSNLDRVINEDALKELNETQSRLKDGYYSSQGRSFYTRSFADDKAILNYLDSLGFNVSREMFTSNDANKDLGSITRAHDWDTQRAIKEKVPFATSQYTSLKLLGPVPQALHGPGKRISRRIRTATLGGRVRCARILR